jgi:hypothetical protein
MNVAMDWRSPSVSMKHSNTTQAKSEGSASAVEQRATGVNAKLANTLAGTRARMCHQYSASPDHRDLAATIAEE